MLNKKAGIGIIFFFLALMVILIVGFASVIIFSVVDIASDEITPIMTELGMVGETNLSEAAEYSFGIADTIVQSLPWMIAAGYVLVLIFSLVFIFISGYNPHPAFMGLYLVLMILLIFLCIIVSNMYQDIYTGDDEIAIRLQEQTAMSYMILYSPLIMIIIAFITGIYIFAGKQTEMQGSFDV